jgi:hypothetical protein
MTGKELQRLLSAHAPRSTAELDHIGRILRDAALVPVGGRGPHVVEYNVDAAALFLIAAAASPTIAEAATTAKTYAALKPVKASFAKAKTFADAVAATLTDIHNVRGVASVEINRTWPCASIVLKSGRRYDYGHITSDARAGVSTKPLHDVVRITFGLLSMLALELAGNETPGGWRE